MPRLGSKHLENMAVCLEIAERTSGTQRDLLIDMALRLEMGAIRIHTEAVQIARSRALLHDSLAVLRFADGLLMRRTNVTGVSDDEKIPPRT